MPDLSPREIEILGLFSEGLTRAEVASRLFLSPSTVKQNADSIFNKLCVPNMVAAVAYALREELIV